MPSSDAARLSDGRLKLIRERMVVGYTVIDVETKDDRLLIRQLLDHIDAQAAEIARLSTQLSEAEAALGDARRVVWEDADYAADLLEWAYGRVPPADTDGAAMTMANIERMVEKLRTLSTTRQQAAQRER